MGNINLYRIDDEKKELCLKDLKETKLENKAGLSFEKVYNKITYNFRTTLYVEVSEQADKSISWNWILQEFKQEPVYTSKAPKAVLLIENTIDEKNTTYAVTFGSAYFRIDKFCDKDFGFRFASRMKYNNVKTTTLTAPNLVRSKTVNTYINYSDLDFNSGESFSKLKVNANLSDDFNIFNPSLEIGNSIKFNINNESICGILDVIGYVENILKIPDEKVNYKIPLFQAIKDDKLLSSLNKTLDEVIVDTLLGKKEAPVFSIPELEIIGANEIFNHTNDFELKYRRKGKMKISSLTIETLTSFCNENKIKSIDGINNIKVVRYLDGEAVETRYLKNMIEYTDDKTKCVFSGGKWYKFNQDYLTYLNNSLKEVPTVYNSDYDFSDEIHNDFINNKYEEEKDCDKYKDKKKDELKIILRNKYYVERCFNILREGEGLFENYDRDGTSAGFEKMDLYEKDTSTMFAVKKGKSSSDLCYAIDQSLTSLKKFKHDEISKMPSIQNVGLWFILERKERLPIIEGNKVDLRSLDMLMLKNRIDQWKKEVRLAGYKPIIYINYRT